MYVSHQGPFQWLLGFVLLFAPLGYAGVSEIFKDISAENNYFQNKIRIT